MRAIRHTLCQNSSHHYGVRPSGHGDARKVDRLAWSFKVHGKFNMHGEAMAGRAKGASGADSAMGAIREITVRSAVQFTEELTKLEFSKRNLWYRGIGDTNHRLTPSLFRHKAAKTKAEFSKLEANLNETFRMRSFPYTEAFRWLDGEWDQLFFMQHYRVPTRLLDWSGSPLVSLHFALTSAKTDDAGKVTADAAVWVLDPVAWNKAVYEGTNFQGDILSPKETRLSRYTPSQVYESALNLPPVAMRGAHNSARIVAQQGFFTIFGPEKKSMEEIFLGHRNEAGDRAFPEECLIKFLIPKTVIANLKSEMFALGISESTIYPDLEGLALELKRTFGF
jgi:hypothetical protein